MRGGGGGEEGHSPVFYILFSRVEWGGGMRTVTERNGPKEKKPDRRHRTGLDERSMVTCQTVVWSYNNGLGAGATNTSFSNLSDGCFPLSAASHHSLLSCLHREKLWFAQNTICPQNSNLLYTDTEKGELI